MMMETVYYTCLNNDCEKHRNIFVEGDPQHQNCARERLYLEGEEEPRGIPAWVWFALPAAAGLGLAAFFLMRRMRTAPASRMESGQISTERQGHAVPPPIA